ncbi:MAG: VanZ family protein [Lachnospiraceae bacterium]
MKKNIDDKIKTVMIFTFVLYLIVLFYFLFFADSMGRTIPGASYRYNLTVFQEIGRFIKYWEIIGAKITILNLGGNIAGFIPFGFLVPFLSEKNKNLYKMVVLSFLLSLLIELLQLVFKVGCFDVDDMLLNTIGGFLGYCIFCIGGFLRRKRNGKKSWKKTSL